jgi:hypothetical protein
LVALPFLALAAGCGRSAPQERRIVPHRVPGCELTSNSGLVVKALGDFPQPFADGVDDSMQRKDLNRLPFELRGVEATSTPPSGLLGVGYADPPDDVHLSLWSSSQSCTPIDDVIPASKDGPAMTAFADGSAVILAGLYPEQRPQDSAFALVFDTRTGEKLGPKDMNAHRLAFATVTPFGRGALIAGGADPKYLPIRPTVKSALVFRDGSFQEPPVALGDDFRAKHGAVVLADGETLLVGGEDENGSALASLIAVAPTSDPPFGQARASGLGSLTTPRKFPTVLRLANDRILVAGGVNDAGEPVPTLEWFEPDGSTCTQSDCPPVQSLFARLDRAFVALSAGGALAVGIGPDPNHPANIVGDVWWITDEGVLDPLTPLTDAQLGTQKPRLVPAANGSPWLWNGVAWFRFDPWLKAFVTPESAPLDGPDSDLPVIAVDPGLMMWPERIQDADSGERVTKMRGFRHDVRGPLASDTAFVFVDRALPHVVPDRPPGTDITIDDDGLHISNDARVVIADATYADVTISGRVHSMSLPALTFGPTFAIGRDCPWPDPGRADAGFSDAGPRMDRTFDVKRSGAKILISVDKGPWKPCERGGPEGRVPIGLAGLGSSLVTISTLTVTRDAAP